MSRKIPPKVPSKNEVSLARSSAAEYLTFVAATGGGGVEAIYDAALPLCRAAGQAAAEPLAAAPGTGALSPPHHAPCRHCRGVLPLHSLNAREKAPGFE